jgi:2',3'-cyclic-nucleotide 2'-phosphodiesterase/3'-nucleotidase
MLEAPAQKTCAGPGFPQVLANVISAKSKAPLFPPYAVISRQVTATAADGRPVQVPLRVGIIGFAPPWITVWDKRHLENRIYTRGVKEAAEQYIPEMRAKGADLVVVISHSGLDGSTYSPAMEQGTYHLAQVPGVDALLMGHSHQVFPNAASPLPQFNLPNVDKVKGTVFGVPAVMAGMWGNTLGVIRLELAWDGRRWTVDRSKTMVEARSTRKLDRSYVDPDPAVTAATAAEHQEAVAYVKTPIGTTDFRMSTYFADVGDPSAIQIVNQAQADHVAAHVKANMPEYAGVPVLSVSAPFKVGFGGANDFTAVAAGDLAINNAADLYIYANTVQAVKIDGAGVKAWLETAARRFNLIDPARTDEQKLTSTSPGYNFDMFTSPDIHYEIDVTQPVNSRIKNLTYKGQPVSPAQEFIVATNNYRASGGGDVPGLDGRATIFQSPDTNRDVLIAYVKSLKKLTRQANGSHRSWRFTRVKTAGPVVFLSAQNRLSDAQAAGLTNVSVLRADDGSGKGLAVYRLDLGR